MDITWSNFLFSPTAVGTLLAAVSGVAIAVTLEWRRTREVREERDLQAQRRDLQANVIFAVLIPPLGEICAAVDSALSDLRVSDPREFVAAVKAHDPVFQLPVPDAMERVFDRLHLLPNPVATELATLYSTLLGFRRLYERVAGPTTVQATSAEGMAQIFEIVRASVLRVVSEARLAKLPVDGLEDIR